MEGFLSQFGYLAILAVLLAAGVGVPFPEEVTQLTAGVLAHRGILDLRATVVVVWFGILAGDFLLFQIARRHGPRVLSSRLVGRLLTPARKEKLEAHFARHAFLTIVVARHAGAVRSAAFALAAASGVRPRTFLLADALSALVSVPVVVGAGYLFSQHLSDVEHGFRIVEGVLVAAAVLAVVLHLRSRRRAARSGAGSVECAGRTEP